jgi:TRAP-type C4-dicarboxylate transport system substrate-binding protein
MREVQTMDARRSTVSVASLVLVAVAASACAPLELTRAGTRPEATTLTIGVADGGGRFTDDVARQFAQQAFDLSDGGLLIEIDRLEDDEAGRRWNQDNVDRVLSGDVDLAIVPAQTWDTYGITSFTPLFVPQLITNDALVDAVALDPLADEMLAGVADLGLSELAVVPGGLRHVFGFGELFDSPEDFDGAAVRVAYSETVWAAYQALGARPDDPNGKELDALVASGEIVAADSMFRLARSFRAPTTAGDLVLHPHVLTLVAGPGVIDALDDEERDAITRAASETAEWAATSRTRDSVDGASLCAEAAGARISLIGSIAIDRFRTALAPLVARITADTTIAARVERIREIDRSLPARPPEVMACP